jgi:hypothetical protein
MAVIVVVWCCRRHRHRHRREWNTRGRRERKGDKKVAECVAWLENGRKVEKTGGYLDDCDRVDVWFIHRRGVLREGPVGGGEVFAPLRLFLKTVWM